MKFGRTSLVAVAATLAVAGSFSSAQAAVEVKGGMPASRQARVGYSPRPAVAVGDVCPTRDSLQSPSQGPWCNNMANAGPIPMGSGVASIPAAAGGNLGTGTVTLQPVEGFTIQSITITTTEPLLLVTSIQAGRALFLESGQIAADLFQSNGTACKLAEGFNVYPSVGISFTFGNPSNTAASVIVSLMGWPQPCPQGKAN